jgi:hypothetical protein
MAGQLAHGHFWLFGAAAAASVLYGSTTTWITGTPNRAQHLVTSRSLAPWIFESWILKFGASPVEHC